MCIFLIKNRDLCLFFHCLSLQVLASSPTHSVLSLSLSHLLSLTLFLSLSLPVSLCLCLFPPPSLLSPSSLSLSSATPLSPLLDTHSHLVHHLHLPVIITGLMLALSSVWMTGEVSGLSLFCITISPAKVRSRSTTSLQLTCNIVFTKIRKFIICALYDLYTMLCWYIIYS